MTDLNHAYPLMDSAADRLKSASGRPLDRITLEALTADQLSAEDLRVSGTTLRAQAEIARAASYPQLADNLSRAAELTAVPNEELLQMYEMLRPGRCTYSELMTLAETLDTAYKAPETARLVREAAAVCLARGLLRRE